MARCNTSVRTLSASQCSLRAREESLRSRNASTRCLCAASLHESTDRNRLAGDLRLLNSKQNAKIRKESTMDWRRLWNQAQDFRFLMVASTSPPTSSISPVLPLADHVHEHVRLADPITPSQLICRCWFLCMFERVSCLFSTMIVERWQ